jgi:ArsR family metal-binding transcriptional regulator
MVIMKDTSDLRAMYETRQEHVNKMHYFEERYNNGTMSEEAYNKQTGEIETTIDATDKMIENEIKNQDLSEQEAHEVRQEVQQEHDKGRGR